MAITTDSLTQDELDYLMYATLSEKVANVDEVIPLSRPDYPTLHLLMRKKKNNGEPVRGGYRFNVKGLRGQKLTHAQHEAFSLRFGEFAEDAYTSGIPGHPTNAFTFQFNPANLPAVLYIVATAAETGYLVFG